VRIVSGEFERDMSVKIVRSGKSIRLSSTHKLFGREREIVDKAYAGDVIGIVGHQDLRIGDTLATQVATPFDAIPTFAPEVFSFLHCVNTERMKQYREGTEQLAREGVVQLLHRVDAPVRVPMMAAVGVLQFDVVRFRLESEYGVQTRLEGAPYAKLRWLGNESDAEKLRTTALPSGVHLFLDTHERPALLFPSAWTLRYFSEQFPDVKLIEAFGAVNIDTE
jgi:peptide chain release factor 3